MGLCGSSSNDYDEGKKSGKKPESKRRNDELSEKDKAALQVKRQRDRLKKYEMEMQKKIDRETEICKQLLKAGKRDKARLALRKKKYQNNLLDKTRGQLLNIEQLIDNIEAAEMQQELMSAMQTGTDLLQQINTEIGSIEDVEKLMDDTAEAIEFQNELNEVLSQSLAEVDEDDVLKELAQIEEMEADQLGLEMPNAPTKALQTEDQKEDIVEEEEEEEKPQKAKKQ